MLKIYTAKAPIPALKGLVRDIRPTWLLEEIGVPYETHFLTDEEFDSDWFGNMNPFRRAPVLLDGDFSMYESAAITLYLADKFEKLAPAKGTPERAKLDQWVFAAISNLETYSTEVFAADFFSEKTEFDLQTRKDSIEMLDRFLPVFDAHLSKTPYLMGQEFSAADVLLSAVMRLTWHTDISKKYGALSAYLEKNYARPSFQRAYAKTGG